VDRIIGSEGFDVEDLAEVLVKGGGRGLPGAADGLGVLEDNPDGRVPSDSFDGPDSSEPGVVEIGADVAVGQGGMKRFLASSRFPSGRGRELGVQSRRF
jgi:hypothetical protein